MTIYRRGSMPAGMAKRMEARRKSNKTPKAPTKVKVSVKKATKPTKTGDKPVKTVKTRGGNYPVYKKSSSSAMSFREAFKAARKSGKAVFTWRGRKYNTKVK